MYDEGRVSVRGSAGLGGGSAHDDFVNAPTERASHGSRGNRAAAGRCRQTKQSKVITQCRRVEEDALLAIVSSHEMRNYNNS
jgi:hypothetical protein